MDAVDKNSFDSFHTRLDDHAWAEALDALLPLIHPVDQDATRIWFAFWPLHLLRLVQESEDVEQMERQLELRGRYRLDQQCESISPLSVWLSILVSGEGGGQVPFGMPH